MLSVAPVALTLRRLKITRFRDVRPGTELHFSDGWNVLLGRNATGKTTLLHLISMALRGDFRELRDEDFSIEYEISAGDWNIRVELRHVVETRVVPEGLYNVALPLRSSDRPEGRVTLRMVIRSGDREHVLVSPPASDPHGDTAEDPSSPSPAGLFLPPHLFQAVSRSKDFVEVLQLGAFGTWPIFRFDEALGYFRKLHGVDEDSVSLPLSGALTAYGNEHAVSVAFFLMPSAGVWSPDRVEGNLVALHGTFNECHHLRWAKERLGATKFQATWPVTQTERRGPSFTSSFGPPTFLLHRAGGTAVSVKHLSFGQKRLFAFAWYLDSNPGPVVADELVNGMHYEWIEDCVRAMEGRQKFVTAQNPLLLDHVGFESPEDVTRSFVLCRAEPLPDNRREVVWTHPSETQAREFFRAYENGVLRVHEILRTEGLW